MMDQQITLSRLLTGGTDSVENESSLKIVQAKPAMPSMFSHRPGCPLLFGDLPEDVIHYFFALLSSHDGLAAEAGLLRHIACISKAHLQFSDRRFRRSTALSLVGTHRAIPEITSHSKDKKQIRFLLNDLLQRYESVYFNLAGRYAIPFMDTIIKMAMQPSFANYLVFDLSVKSSKKEQGSVQNFSEDNKRLEVVIDATFLVDTPTPNLKIALFLKGRHLFPSMIKRLAAGHLPLIHKLDLSDVKLIAPHRPFNPELHGFFLPELLRYLQIFIQEGELKELSLSGLALVPSNVQMLVSLLFQGKVLSMLDLSDNSVSGSTQRFEKGLKDGVDAIEQLLRSTSCPCILKLNNSGIDDADATRLLTALPPPQVMQQLHLHGNAIAADHPVRLDARVKID